jgi:hypothetical protein
MKEIAVRGHHLELFASRLPKERLEVDARMLALEFVGSVYMDVKMVSNVSMRKYDGKNYQQDVFGDNEEEVAETQRKLTEAVLAILTLPDDTSIRLVADERGIICKTCTVGKHCLSQNIDGERYEIQRFFSGLDIDSTTTLGNLREKLSLVSFVDEESS